MRMAKNLVPQGFFKKIPANTVSRQLVEHLSSANENQAGQTESKQLKNPGIMRFPGFSYTQAIKMPAMSEAKKKANGL